MSKPNENQTIKDQLGELDTQLAWFDGDDFTVEEALDRYKVAEKLAGSIETQLTTMKNEISVLKTRFDEEK